MTEEQVFLAALDLPDAAGRAAYLDKTCGGDAAFRRQVESLLAAHFKSGEFLDVPAAEQGQAGSRHDNTVAQEGDAPSPRRPSERGGRAEDNTVAHEGDAVSAAKGREDDSEELPFLTPSARPDSLGRLGHYEMLQVLGKGGFGIVFRAFDDTLQRVVAVKVMAPQIASLSPARKRFLREARSSAAIRHENVVHVYEVGEQPFPYLVMEFVPGETLQQKLDRSGPLEVSEVLRIGRQIAEGLAAAHASDLIHRDVKPANILLEGGSQKVKITDFGLARAADDASISQSGVIAGTPMFMAPEQALGHKIDRRADLFSLGSVLYQMVSGRPPFRAPSALAVLKRVAEEPPRPIPEIIPETPAWLCEIIAKLHAKNPDDRFQSAREVADVLGDCEAKLKAKEQVKNVLPAAIKPTGSTRWKWIVAAAVLLLPVIALVVTEIAGVTHLFRQQATTDPDQVRWRPTAIHVANNADGWVQLFNGKDLTGWKYHPKLPGAWKVQNGLLMSSGPASFLFSERDDFANFHVRAEVKISPKGNSGLFFRASWNLLDRPDVPRPGGHEAQIFGGYGSLNTGSLLEETDSLSRMAKDFFTPPDEWFVLEVIANGNRITIKVNGKTTVDCTEANQIHTKGHIALQQFTPETVVQFRKIEIKELPPSPLPPTFTNSIGMEFVIVPKGKSWLGGGKDKLGDEVEFPADFYLGKYEVTQEEWEKVMGENPSWFSRTGGGKDAVKDITDADLKRFPVERVTWDQCQLFVAKLNKLEKETGWVYRLPREAEWEYACRGGPMADKLDSAFDFYFAKPTNTLLPELANFGKDKGLNRTCKVGSYEPNRLGLFDMHGNAWEWCDDSEITGDGTSRHVVRGGSWHDDPVYCWASCRAAFDLSDRHSHLGLRLAGVPSGAP